MLELISATKLYTWVINKVLTIKLFEKNVRKNSAFALKSIEMIFMI